MSTHREIQAWLDVVSVGVNGDVGYVTGDNVAFLDSDADVQYLMATSGCFRLPAANQPRLSRVVLHATPPLQRRAAYDILSALGGILRMVWRELPGGVGEYKVWFRRPQLVHEIAHNPLVLLQGTGFVYVEVITDDLVAPQIPVWKYTRKTGTFASGSTNTALAEIVASYSVVIPL